jgi:hypothetical protein
VILRRAELLVIMCLLPICVPAKFVMDLMRIKMDLRIDGKMMNGCILADVNVLTIARNRVSFVLRFRNYEMGTQEVYGDLVRSCALSTTLSMHNVQVKL